MDFSTTDWVDVLNIENQNKEFHSSYVEVVTTTLNVNKEKLD